MRELVIYVKTETLHKNKFVKIYSLKIYGYLTAAEIFQMFIHKGFDSTTYYKGVVKEKGYANKVCILKRPEGGIWEEITLNDIKFKFKV
jgi:hypothetical protein